MTEIPHFKFPLQLTGDGTRAQVVEQDSDDEILDCIEVLLATTQGERIEIPNYGIRDQAFRQNGADTAHILAQIRKYEERANINLAPDVIRELVQRVGVEYRGGLVG